MRQVNMLEAKTHLSRLIKDLESGAEDEIVIARDGKAIASLRLRNENAPSVKERVGAARGQFDIPDDIDSPFPDLPAMFGEQE